MIFSIIMSLLFLPREKTIRKEVDFLFQMKSAGALAAYVHLRKKLLFQKKSEELFVTV